MENKFTIGAFAIILDNQKRILLCHRRDHDFWNLPGGRVEYNEAPWEAVVREVKEETGFDVKVTRLLGVYSKRNETDIVFSFACEVMGGVITINDEADEITYFSLDEIPKNTSPKQVERIKDFFNYQGEEIIMKIQQGPSSIDLFKQEKL
ncbi:MAG: NUDIX hydrolase [Patescibacteria group bacterium]|nr:NUDIX hydrolase [Patescibacteria group bacterium]MDD4610654.1 NUDIX hydrolase [Patescibacteria group bacterium]